MRKRSGRFLSLALAMWLALHAGTPCWADLDQKTKGAAILRIRVIEGDGAVHAAGTRASTALAVEITDETGKPVEGAVVNFRLPSDGPGGVFVNGLNTDVVVTGADGRATVRRMLWNRTTGAFQVRVTAAKNEVRAGTVVSQYLSDASVSEPASSSAKSRSLGKWLAVGLIAGGVAAGAIVASVGLGSGASSGTDSVVPSVVSVGTPSFSIGRPQ